MTNENEHSSELSYVKPIEESTKNEEAQENKPSLSIAEHIRKFLNFITVEPFLICYILPSIISALAVQSLNMEKACRVDLNYSVDVCSEVIAGNVIDNITKEALDKAQILVADMTAWQQPLQSGIPAIVILFVGAWSDRTGNRKALMLVPILGELISALGLILTTYYFLEWPLWVTALIEALPTAFSGGWSVALLGAYSFIADVTTVESRTFRIGVVAIIATLGIPIGLALSGILTTLIGYYGVFTLGAVLYVLGFLNTLYRIHDTKRVTVEGTLAVKIKQFFDPENAWSTLSLLFLSRGKELLQIWLVVIAHIVVMGPVMGEAALLYLYTLGRYNMDVVEFSLFNTYSVLMGLAGTTVAIAVFSKYLSIHDGLIGVLASSCKVVSSFVYGLAPNRTWFFAGPIFDFFGNSGTTIVRSLGTKVVSTDKVAKMCSLIGFVEAIVPVIYTPLYSKLYSNFLETLPGLYYIVGGVMTVPAIFIFLSIYIMHKRQEKDVVLDPTEKEKYAHDNAVTVL